MKSTKIILFSGFARNGKDQSATFLKEELEKSGKTVVIYHFADALKSVAIAIIITKKIAVINCAGIETSANTTNVAFEFR